MVSSTRYLSEEDKADIRRIATLELDIAANLARAKENGETGRVHQSISDLARVKELSFERRNLRNKITKLDTKSIIVCEVSGVG